ncbi:GTPase IMAP family member 8-like [Engraulis encrasicolus]|uniref:GTPase IMAP family member 8-like n=1 Tax=Engraulis encrasicolus TaxID=184585 RepID=UPI002FD759CC
MASGGLRTLNEYRIVLLGYRWSGKSSSGNTILGREEFDLKRTAQCVKRRGDVAGRQLTVVEAPGWWVNENLKGTPKLTKQEIVLSVSLCAPGPHIFLLHVDVADDVTPEDIKNMMEHVDHLGEGVWSHTMVLFTNGDRLGNTPIELYIESEEALQALVEKCGNRYHVLNNMDKGNRKQITELLEKMEEIICGNGGRHYEMDSKRLEEVMKRREEDEERATARLMKVEEQRQHLQSLKGDLDLSFLLSEFRIVLLGYRLSGKSSSGNTILGREEFDLKRTAQCVKRQGEVAGRQLTVVEAPGWWKNKNLKATTELTKQEIVLSVSLCPPGPHIFLLHVYVAHALTPEDIDNMMEHVNHLGEGVWSHTMVLFTFGDLLGDTPIELYIESEEALQSLVEKCGNRYHVLNNMDKGDKTQITELLEKMEEIICRNRGRHYEQDRKRLEEVMKRREKATARLMKVEERRQHLQSLKEQVLLQLEFRFVLLGYKKSGKSSSGNTILDREEFDWKRTAQCVKRQGEVAGRQLTVVEAPGWWKNKNLKATTELTKQEIELSVSLCPPGPHIFILHVYVTHALTPEDIKNMVEHVDYLGEGVWSHTMVLFTRGDRLGDTPIELYIESEGALQSLVEKCGNRYHVLNNMDKGDRTQITELLEKMEEIICGNGGRHYEMDRKRLEEVMKRREEDEERATARRMKVEEQRQHLQSLKGEFFHFLEFRIVLLGYRLSGKSSSGNTILGREEFDLKRTAQCVKRQGEVAGRQLTVVEAPAWKMDENLQDTPELTKQEIVLSVSVCPPGPQIFLLHVDVADDVTPDDIENMVDHVNHLGEGVWSHTMVLFTNGDLLGDTPIELYIESEGALQSLVEKCGNRYHVLNNMDKGDRTQITELLEKMEEIICGNGGRHYEMDRKRLEEVMKRREEDEERATARLKKVEEQRQHLQSLKEQVLLQLEFRIVHLGYRNSGKSSSGNTILGRKEFELKTTARSVKRQGEDPTYSYCM